MGQKSNPIILRLNKTNQHWNSCWYSDDNYATSFLQDCKINAYIKSSQQQLERFPPLSFIKRQRGDLQIALFSAKPAHQFSKLKHNRYKNSTINPVTHSIFKGSSLGEGPIHKDYTLYDDLVLSRAPSETLLTRESTRSSSTKLISPLSTPPSTPLIRVPKKREYFRLQLFLAMGSNSGRLVLDNMSGTKLPLHMKTKETPPGVISRPFYGVQESINLATINKTTFVKIVDPAKNHLEYSTYKYYNGHNAPLSTVRSKLYLVKSPSIYQNPLFLASQVVSLLEKRAVFRQIKHRVVREIRKNPTIRGVRIVCSGRVASRSKKAQKARRESIQWGATSLNVFSEHVNFAHSFAQTTFGKIGVKVWISHKFI